MSNAALALSALTPSKWTIRTGPMAGTVRVMNLAEFAIGRSSDCEFVLTGDPKCSRRHARVLTTAMGVEVVVESEKNRVLVNGQPIERALLQHGDIVTIGDTQIEMQPYQAAGPGYLSLAPEAAAPAAYTRPSSLGNVAMPAAPAAPKPLGRILLYGSIAVVVGFLLLPGKNKKKLAEIRGETQIQADLDTANKLRDSAQKQLVRGTDQSVTARQAQENYVRGFRDYERGQFERSLISFQSCLALNPDHVLCNRYMRLGQRKFDEVVQTQMVLGRKYRDQNQFRSCRAAFRNVMVMIKDSNSPIFSEAKANYDACDSLIEGHY